MKEGSQTCRGCGRTYKVYGPLVDKKLYRCLSCELNYKPVTSGSQPVHVYPRLDQLEEGTSWYK